MGLTCVGRVGVASGKRVSAGVQRSTDSRMVSRHSGLALQGSHNLCGCAKHASSSVRMLVAVQHGPAGVAAPANCSAAADLQPTGSLLCACLWPHPLTLSCSLPCPAKVNVPCVCVCVQGLRAVPDVEDSACGWGHPGRLAGAQQACAARQCPSRACSTGFNPSQQLNKQVLAAFWGSTHVGCCVWPAQQGAARLPLTTTHATADPKAWQQAMVQVVCWGGQHLAASCIALGHPAPRP